MICDERNGGRGDYLQGGAPGLFQTLTFDSEDEVADLSPTRGNSKTPGNRKPFKLAEK
jgi:hypothetical protein